MTVEADACRGILFVTAIDPLPLLDPTAAAARLKLKRHTLACYRSLGSGPAYYQLGRWIRYAEPDLEAWAIGQSEPVRPALFDLACSSGTIPMVTAGAAARFLTLTRFCLANYRREESGPLFHRYGRRLFYSVHDLRDWVRSQRRTPWELSTTNIEVSEG